MRWTSVAGVLLVALLGLVQAGPVAVLAQEDARADVLPTAFEDSSRKVDYPSPWVHDLGRATFAGAAVEPSMFLANLADYGSAIGVMATVIIVVGVAMCCCGCCVSFLFFFRSRNNRMDDDDGNPMLRLIVRVSLAVGPIAILVVMIVALVGNAVIGPGEQFFMDRLDEEAGSFTTVLNSLTPAMDSTELGRNWGNQGRTFSEQFGPFARMSSDAVSDIDDAAVEARSRIEQSESGRLATFGLMLAFGIITMILSCAAAALSMRELAQLTALCSFLVVSISAVTLAGHFAINVVLADLCNDMRVYEAEDSGLFGVDGRLADRELDYRTSYPDAPELDYTDTSKEAAFMPCVNYTRVQLSRGWVDDLRNDTILAYNSGNCTSCCTGGTCTGTGCNATACTGYTDDLLLMNNLLTETFTYLEYCNWTKRVLSNSLANTEADCGDDLTCGSICGAVISSVLQIHVCSFVLMILFCCLGVCGALGDSHIKAPAY